MAARLHYANHLLQKTMSSIFIYSMLRKIGYETIWRTLCIYNSCFYIKLRQFNPKTISKWTKNTDIFSKKYLVIPICRGHHWTLVIVRTHPHISLMILDSLNKEHRSVELKITRYLQDVWSAKLPQRAKKNARGKTDQVSNDSTTTKQHRLWFVHYEMFWKVPWLCQQKLTMVVMESRILP